MNLRFLEPIINNFLKHNTFKDLIKLRLNLNYNQNTKKFIDNKYRKELILRNDNYEIYLIYWGKNSETKIHNHSKNGCIMNMVEGYLRETIYDKDLKPIKTNTYHKNDSSFISDDVGYHSIQNNSGNECVSMHIYSPPKFLTKYFD